MQTGLLLKTATCKHVIYSKLQHANRSSAQNLHIQVVVVFSSSIATAVYTSRQVWHSLWHDTVPWYVLCACVCVLVCKCVCSSCPNYKDHARHRLAPPVLPMATNLTDTDGWMIV